MGAIPATTLKAFLDGNVDLLGDTIKALLVDATYVHNAAHDFLNDVAGGARVGTSDALTTKATTAGAFTADPVAFSTPPTDDAVGMWLYIDTGTEATSRLVAWIDKAGDRTAFRVASGRTDPIPFTGPMFTI